jgi:SSS family transporter
MNSWLLISILAYIGVQLGIGAWISRRIASDDDYLLAGRRLGYGLATFSIFATWFGAETCLGGAGQVYGEGLSIASTEPFGYGACLILLGVVFAVPLWRRRLVTLADLFRTRFSAGVERVAALLMIPTSALWAAAQIRAFGHVLAGASAVQIETGILVAAGVVVAYTALGGLLADAITDVVQGIALLLGLAIMLALVVAEIGGAGPALAAIQSVQALRAPPATPLLATLEAWAVPVLGSVVAQELVARIAASRSPQVARRSSLAAGFAYVAVGSIPVALGLLGAHLLPDLADGEQVLPRLAQDHLPTWGAALFAGALVSAILSTVDSTLLVCSSLLSHNLVLPLLPPQGERAKLRLARAGVIGFGALATVMAWHGDSVSDLVHEASALGSAGILVCVVFGLFTKLGDAASAQVALVGGALVYVGGVAAGLAHPYLTSLGVALGAYLLVAAASGRTAAAGRPAVP